MKGDRFFLLLAALGSIWFAAESQAQVRSSLTYRIVGDAGFLATSESGAGLSMRAGLRARWSRIAVTFAPIEYGEMEEAADLRYRETPSGCEDTIGGTIVDGRLCEARTRSIGSVSADVTTGSLADARLGFNAGVGYRLLESDGPYVLVGLALNRRDARLSSYGTHIRFSHRFFELAFGLEYRLGALTR